MNADHPLLQRCRATPGMEVEFCHCNDGSWLVTANMPDRAVLDVGCDDFEGLDAAMTEVLTEVDWYVRRAAA